MSTSYGLNKRGLEFRKGGIQCQISIFSKRPVSRVANYPFRGAPLINHVYPCASILSDVATLNVDLRSPTLRAQKHHPQSKMSLVISMAQSSASVDDGTTYDNPVSIEWSSKGYHVFDVQPHTDLHSHRSCVISQGGRWVPTWPRFSASC